MNNIRELKRLNSPAPKPQSLAWGGSTLWMGSRETKRIYAIDPTSWTVSWETTAPGNTVGHGGCGERTARVVRRNIGRQRIIRRCVPGQGFDKVFALPCPDDCGSHLSFDVKSSTSASGIQRNSSPWAMTGRWERVIKRSARHLRTSLCRRCFYLATTDAEESERLLALRAWDPRPEQPKIEDLVRIPFAARRWRLTGRISGPTTANRTRLSHCPAGFDRN